MSVQIGQKQESDFSDPLGLLSDCHRRIEHFLAVLVRVSETAKGRVLEPVEKTALENALAYFRNSAPKHTADEEDSLFPRLRAAAEAIASLGCVAGLEQDHQLVTRDHHIVDSLGRVWMERGELTTAEHREMTQALKRLSDTYSRHIAVEDQELFPLAARILQSDDISEMGLEMARRRGVKR